MQTNESHQRRAVAISVAILIGAMGGMTFLRFYLFPDRFLSLSYGLPLLICLWHQDRVLLWVMSVVFCVMSGFKAFYLVPDHNSQDWYEMTQWLMHVANIVVIALAVHAILNLSDRLRAQNAALQAQAEQLARNNDQLELEVQKRTADLQESVAELKHVSYAMIHDMRAPLRALQGFSNILLQECPQLDEASRQNLDRIVTTANRLDQLIIGTLNYTAAVQQAMPLSPIDPAKLLKEMMESYPAFQSPGTAIAIDGAMPVVIANEMGLTQCFSALLNNAVKFVKPGQRAEIKIWAEPKGSFVRFWIKDNGIGMPREVQARIFALFQQASRNSEGIGLGLALCRKVVERMGGKIGVVSETGQGCQFWVELKRAE